MKTTLIARALALLAFTVPAFALELPDVVESSEPDKAVIIEQANPDTKGPAERTEQPERPSETTIRPKEEKRIVKKRLPPKPIFDATTPMANEQRSSGK